MKYRKTAELYKTATVERDIAAIERRLAKLDKEIARLTKETEIKNEKETQETPTTETTKTPITAEDVPEELRKPFRDREALKAASRQKARLLDTLNFQAPAEHRTFDEPQVDEFLRAIDMLPKSTNVDESVFPVKEYAALLVKFRSELTDAQIEAEKNDAPMKLDLSKNASFVKILEYDDKLNAMLQSADPGARDAARAARDEAWRLSVEESSKERIEKLKSLDPKTAEKLADGRSKAAEEWLGTSKKEFQNLFGRPDNMLGLYVVGSLIPFPGLMFLLPVVLPALKTLFDALLMNFFHERARTITLMRTSIESQVLRDAAQANVLRLLGSAAEKHGMSPTETYGLYVDQLQNPESVLRRVDGAFLRDVSAKELSREVAELTTPLRDANAVRTDAVGAFLDCELAWKDGRFVYKKEPAAEPARAAAELARINRKMDGAHTVEYLANESYIGSRASIRPAEAVLLAKAIAASPKNVDFEELLLRALPANTAEKNPANVKELKDVLLRQYGDCVRIPAERDDPSLFRDISVEELKLTKDPEKLRYVSCEGRKFVQMSPIVEVKELTLEHLLIAAACGREPAKKEIAERARADQEAFRISLAALCNRMVHDKIRTLEESVVVGFAKNPETPEEITPVSSPKENKESFDPVTPFSQSGEFSAFRDEKDRASSASEKKKEDYSRESFGR